MPDQNTGFFDAADSLAADIRYQKARIALRDRTGTEPDIEHVHQVARIMEDRSLTPAAAVSAWQPAETQAAAARMAPAWSRGFGIAVSRDGVGHAATIDADDSGPAGLARLRAHAALDALLDQHGITR